MCHFVMDLVHSCHCKKKSGMRRQSPKSLLGRVIERFKPKCRWTGRRFASQFLFFFFVNIDEHNLIAWWNYRVNGSTKGQ